MGTGLKFLFEEEVTMRQGTILGSHIGRWIILAALVALLGALLLTIRPVGAQQDTPPVPDPIESRTISVPEDTVDVYTFSANDPDNDDRKIYWTLGGTDAAFFKIDSNGVLEFKKAPNYEGPGDGVDDVNSDGQISPAEEGVGNNVYEVTVRMSSGGEDGVPGDNNHTGDDVEEVDVTVTVSNVNEMGTVVFYPRQPQIGSTVRAYLTDPDGGVGGEIWQWASSTSMSGPFTDIPALSGDSAYRPTGEDHGDYLRVTVKYVDAAGGTADDPNKAYLVSTLKVREDTVTSNAAPKFPDQRTLGIAADVNVDGAATGTLVYARLQTERFILENSSAGTNVGAPVTAFDDAARIDKLGYSIADGTEPGQTNPSAGHADNFRIDLKTGQITVAPGAQLDAEVAAASVYYVKVTAIDGDEAFDSINVTIRVHDVNEGPKIRSTYLADITGTGHEIGERVPTEMSHPEVDRRSSKYQAVRNTLRDEGDTSTNIAMRVATIIDTDLDNGVTYINLQGTTTPGTADSAIYFAMDPDGDEETGDLVWSLEGPDEDWFTITPGAFEEANGGLRATLAFEEAPDWEMPRDKARSSSNNNVYEVTLVVTDANSGLKAELPVTVKVINSGEDNEPGKVRILNRQPEIGIELVAELTDPDTPLNNVKWQWYRAVETSTGGASAGQGVACEPRDPFDAPTNPTDPYDGFRYFLDTSVDVNGVVGGDSEAVGTASTEGWQPISGATGTGATATYTPDFKASGATGTRDDIESNATQEVVDWTGGDIAVTVTTETDATPHTVTYSDWENPKCLRVAFTYEDAVDRTFQQADPDPNDGVNQTLESAFVGSENSVKRHDLNNKKPEFQGIADASPFGPNGITVLTYTVDKAEDASAADLAFSTTTEVLPAVDDADDNEEDDRTSIGAGLGDDEDRLTYSLSGADAKYFVIVGSVDHPTQYDYDETININTQGQLSFKRDTKLEFDRPDDKRVYRVTITARDPSGDKGSSSVDVIVNITDVNEAPDWVKPIDGISVRYEENGTDAVVQFEAKNPETPNPGPGISYSFATEAVTDILDAADMADNGQFSIDPLNGNLSFKSPPNYEKPQDVVVTGGTNPAVAGDNKYRVAVQAVAADPVTDPVTPVTTTTVYRKITVIVTNVNEDPVFSEEEFTLRIKENADDLHKEPIAERGPLYELNRGVGIPGVNLPVAPNLDVGTPMAAGDDDSTSTFTIGGPDNEVVDRIDGLTYELMGSADALEAFAIVPATGQILSQKKLDHEVKSTYEVKVKATDPDGAYDTIALTIEVVNEEEQPIPVTVQIAGEISLSHEENSTDDLGDYTTTATGTDATPALSLDGDDEDYFSFTGSGTTKTLKFKPAPDYENPRGAEMSDTNTNTYMVTVMGTVKDTRGNDVTGTKNVTIMVTNDPELGDLSGSETESINEGYTDLGTYTLTAIEDGPKVTWSKDGADEGLFMLVGTGMSRMLKFSSAPDYESPMGGADNDSNTYMVTVMAKAGGEMRMVEVTVTVDNVDELGTLDEPTKDTSVMEGDTDVATYTLTGGDGTSTVAWSLEGDDAEHFTIMDGMLKFSSAPDYESPMGGAADDSNTYMVTVMAKAGGEMDMVAVTITVTNMEEDGTVTLMPMRPSVGTAIMATLEDPDMVMEDTVMWQWASADAMDGDFTNIDDATMYTYTPVEGDAGMYLKAMASYTDGYGADSAEMVTGTAVAQLAVNGEPAVEISEGERNVGTYMASGADNVAWSLTGDDAGDFSINGGQLTFGTAPDFENPADADMDNVYMVTVVARATVGTLMASQEVMVTVTDMDEGGMVTVMPTSAMVGTVLTAILDDPDGGQTAPTWQWSRSGTDIDGATSATYTVADSDAGMSLMATATYDDVHGRTDCHQRRRNGRCGRRAPAGSPRLRHQRYRRDPNRRGVRRDR